MACLRKKLFVFMGLPALFLAFVGTSILLLPQVVTSAEQSYDLFVPSDIVFVSTIGGDIAAVDSATGALRWTVEETPIIRSTLPAESHFTFLPNPQDGSLYTMTEEGLKKLPFSIPALVHASPCRSKEGVLYAGKKEDMWFGLDPKTGNITETLNFSPRDALCPVPSDAVHYIGRTEYHIAVADVHNVSNRWNATYVEYSSYKWRGKSRDSNAVYFSSCSDGMLVAVDPITGQIRWQKNFSSTVVAVYEFGLEGLKKMPMHILGRSTLNNILFNSLSQAAGHGFFTPPPDRPENSLHPSLYIGANHNGLYAVPAFVDQKTFVIEWRKQNVPLLEGPHPIEDPEVKRSQAVPTELASKVDLESVSYEFFNASADENKRFLLGYYELPDTIPSYVVFDALMSAPKVSFITDKAPLISSLYPAEWKNSSWLYACSLPKVRPLLIHFFALAWGVVMVALLYKRKGFLKSRFSFPVKFCSFLFDGYVSNREFVRIGQILLNSTKIIGRGSDGTVVYAGMFDHRSIAVKRIILDYAKLANREVNALRQADTHPNVIRYFCMETDRQFCYIALELCSFTMEDYVEKKYSCRGLALDILDALYQTTSGLAWLHEFGMVHRDVKPSNVLFAPPDKTGACRVKISDFGLCKRISQASVTQSGFAGTLGWTAPEIVHGDETVTFAADVFSLGCLFYYALSNGLHAFGDANHRQVNIITGHDEIGDFVNYESRCLIKQMVSQNYASRPCAKEILKHPIFWTNEKRLQFLQDVSDRIENEEISSPIVRNLERGSGLVTEYDWKKRLCPALQDDLQKFRSYRARTLRDLLRAIRNKRHHYLELSEELRAAIGSPPDEFVAYFTDRFPKLIMHVYDAMSICRAESVLARYY